jgi:hypothetical protein
MPKNNKRFALISVIIIPIFYFVVFTANNWIFGHDARYLNGLFGIYHSPLIANLFVIAVWYATLFSFTMVEDKKQNPLFIGSLFLLNLFNIRLLMPEPDNWIFLLAGMFIILYFKNNPIKRFHINHITVGIFTVFIYFAYRGFVMVNPNGYADLTPNLLVLGYLLPTYYILAKRRQFVILTLILASVLVFPTGKYVTNSLPLLIYAIYLDFVSSEGLEKLENDRIIKFLVFFSLVAFLFVPFLEIMWK